MIELRNLSNNDHGNSNNDFLVRLNSGNSRRDVSALASNPEWPKRPNDRRQ
jgi:hypothetical protein